MGRKLEVAGAVGSLAVGGIVATLISQGISQGRLAEKNTGLNQLREQVKVKNVQARRQKSRLELCEKLRDQDQDLIKQLRIEAEEREASMAANRSGFNNVVANMTKKIAFLEMPVDFQPFFTGSLDRSVKNIQRTLDFHRGITDYYEFTPQPAGELKIRVNGAFVDTLKTTTTSLQVAMETGLPLLCTETTGFFVKSEKEVQIALCPTRGEDYTPPNKTAEFVIHLEHLLERFASATDRDIRIIRGIRSAARQVKKQPNMKEGYGTVSDSVIKALSAKGRDLMSAILFTIKKQQFAHFLTYSGVTDVRHLAFVATGDTLSTTLAENFIDIALGIKPETEMTHQF